MGVCAIIHVPPPYMYLPLKVVYGSMCQHTDDQDLLVLGCRLFCSPAIHWGSFFESEKAAPYLEGERSSSESILQLTLQVRDDLDLVQVT